MSCRWWIRQSNPSLSSSKPCNENHLTWSITSLQIMQKCPPLARMSVQMSNPATTPHSEQRRTVFPGLLLRWAPYHDHAVSPPSIRKTHKNWFWLFPSPLPQYLTNHPPLLKSIPHFHPHFSLFLREQTTFIRFYIEKHYIPPIFKNAPGKLFLKYFYYGTCLIVL